MIFYWWCVCAHLGFWGVSLNRTTVHSSTLSQWSTRVPTRRHGRAALRGISRALAGYLRYMLAQIAEEITSLIVLLKIRGRGTTAIMRTLV